MKSVRQDVNLKAGSPDDKQASSSVRLQQVQTHNVQVAVPSTGAGQTRGEAVEVESNEEVIGGHQAHTRDGRRHERNLPPAALHNVALNVDDGWRHEWDLPPAALHNVALNVDDGWRHERNLPPAALHNVALNVDDGRRHEWDLPPAALHNVALNVDDGRRHERDLPPAALHNVALNVDDGRRHERDLPPTALHNVALNVDEGWRYERDVPPAALHNVALNLDDCRRHERDLPPAALHNVALNVDEGWRYELDVPPAALHNVALNVDEGWRYEQDVPPAALHNVALNVDDGRRHKWDLPPVALHNVALNVDDGRRHERDLPPVALHNVALNVDDGQRHEWDLPPAALHNVALNVDEGWRYERDVPPAAFRSRLLDVNAHTFVVRSDPEVYSSRACNPEVYRGGGPGSTRSFDEANDGRQHPYQCEDEARSTGNAPGYGNSAPKYKQVLAKLHDFYGNHRDTMKWERWVNRFVLHCEVANVGQSHYVRKLGEHLQGSAYEIYKGIIRLEPNIFWTELQEKLKGHFQPNKNPTLQLSEYNCAAWEYESKERLNEFVTRLQGYMHDGLPEADEKVKEMLIRVKLLESLLLRWKTQIDAQNRNASLSEVVKLAIEVQTKEIADKGVHRITDALKCTRRTESCQEGSA